MGNQVGPSAAPSTPQVDPPAPPKVLLLFLCLVLFGYGVNGQIIDYFEELTCTVEQGTDYTFCLGRSSDGSSRYCYDIGGNQIKQDRTMGDVDCSGRPCYVGGFDPHMGSLFGVCETTVAFDAPTEEAPLTTEETINIVYKRAGEECTNDGNEVVLSAYTNTIVSGLCADGLVCESPDSVEPEEGKRFWGYCVPQSTDAVAPTGCSEETLEAAQMWEDLGQETTEAAQKWNDLVVFLSGKLRRRRSLKNVNDVFGVLSDMMHSGEILNVKY